MGAKKFLPNGCTADISTWCFKNSLYLKYTIFFFIL